MGRWLAVLVMGLMVGAGVVLLAEPGVSESGEIASPKVLPKASSSGLTDLNGHEIHGVKALDVAAEQEPDKPLDRATRGVLAQQLTLARATAMKYPTGADAQAAGYHLVGGFGPGAGAHYVGGFFGGSGQFDASRPGSLIYDGTSPDSQIVGLMYLGMGASGAPEGFAGPNDHWHYHTNTCLKYGANGEVDAPFGADTEVTADMCAQVGGQLMKQTQWMVHVWSVAGWESQQGLFGEVNPALTCSDGTYYILPPDQWIGHPLNNCLAG